MAPLCGPLPFLAWLIPFWPLRLRCLVTASRKLSILLSLCHCPLVLHRDILVSALGRYLSMVPFRGRTPVNSRLGLLPLPAVSGGQLCASFFWCQTCRMEMKIPTASRDCCECLVWLSSTQDLHKLTSRVNPATHCRVGETELDKAGHP